MKRVVFCAAVLLCLLPAGAVFAQTADEVERLLGLSTVTYEQAAWLLFRAADVPAQSAAQAFNSAKEQKWIGKKVQAGDIARLDRISLLVMRSFGIDGGALYNIFLSPHYAYRELIYKNIIQGRADPSTKVSGEELIFIIGRVMNLIEEGR